MRITRHSYTTRGEKTIDFMIGFVGWFIFNIIVGGAVYLGPTFLDSILVAGQTDPQRIVDLQNIVGFVALGLSGLSWLLNIGLLFFFGFTRYWIALGMLAALAVSGLIILCLGVMMGVLCFSAFAGYRP